MATLPELQARFRAALLADDDAVTGDVLGDGLPAAARIQIYRHHVFTTLTAALEATYPVVCRLVDRRFFAYAADAYIRRHPPDGPCLAEYGASFPEFVAGFPACAELPYLADVARLEWAMNVAFHAADVPSLVPAALGDVPPEVTPELRLRLHPSLSLLASPWPIDLIRRAHREEGEEIVHLDAGGACLQVRRRDDDVVLRKLDGAEYAFRRALADGRRLEEAADAALAIDDGFDLAGAMRDLFDEDVLVGFEMATPTTEMTS